MDFVKHAKFIKSKSLVDAESLSSGVRHCEVEGYLRAFVVIAFWAVMVSVHCQLSCLESPEKRVSMRDGYTRLACLREVLLITFMYSERHISLWAVAFPR